MITDRINALIIKIESVRNLEARQQNQANQKKSEDQYRKLVNEATGFTNAVTYARDNLGFSPSFELHSGLKHLLEKLRDVPASGVIQDSEIQYVKANLDEMKSRMRKEWSQFYPEFSQVSYTLKVIQAFDNERAGRCLIDIESAKVWSGDLSRLQRLAAAIKDATILISSLNLDYEIIVFLSKVSEGKARISDLTNGVVDWIKGEGLENYISLSFVPR